MNIWFWGAGKYLEKIVDVILDKEMIAGIVDKSQALHGFKVNGIMVLGPEEAKISREDMIIITAFLQYEEIYLEAVECFNIAPDRVLCFFDERTNYHLWKEYIDSTKWEMVYQNILMKRKIEKLENEIIYSKNLKYEIPDMLRKGKISYPCIRSGEEALYKIIIEKKSMCRFGDGEFEIIAGRKRPDFQLPDEQLGRRLKEILLKEDERILTCIADNYGSLEAYTEDAANGIRAYLTEQVRQEHMELLEGKREFFDAYVSRPYIMYKNRKRAKDLFGLWKKVWENKKVIIVEGNYTRNGYKNDLFSNAESVYRILAPAENAWGHYQQILGYILEHVDKDILIIISLGPTATVLAYDLTIFGYQAIDMGHIDNEYEWFLRKAEERFKIRYKYVHEITGGKVVEDINDEGFCNQVIARIGC